MRTSASWTWTMAVGVCAMLALMGAMAGAADTTIRVTGAEALMPLIQKMAADYQAANPQVKIEVTGGGAGKGVKEAMAGRVELGMVSRELDEMESKRLAGVAVAKDAVFATVSAANPAAKALQEKGLGKKTMKALWVGGKALTWGDLAGTDSKDKVTLYTREDACGAAEMWAKSMNSTQADLKGTPVKGDKGVAEAVGKDPAGLGYNNLGAAFNPTTGAPTAGIAVVSIDVNDNGRVDPQEDVSTLEKAKKAIGDGTYPAPPARSLYLVTKGEFSGETAKFVRWILNDGQKLVEQTGFVRVSDAELKAAQQKLAK